MAVTPQRVSKDLVKPRPLKFVLIGDPSVGKTSLLSTYANNKVPDEQSLNSLETTAKLVTIDGEMYNVTLVDTNGSSSDDKLRTMSYYYPPVDIFIICYDITEKSSFDHILSKWIPEAKKYCPAAQIFIVGTKLDQLSPNGNTNVSESLGVQLRNSTKNACGFLQISCKNVPEVDSMFYEIVKIAREKYPQNNGRN